MRIWRNIRHQRWGAGLALALAMVVGFGVPFGDASSYHAAIAMQPDEDQTLTETVDPAAPEEVDDSTEKDAPASTESADDTAETPEQPSEGLEAELLETADEEALAPQSIAPQTMNIAPFVAGPEGGTAPYVYWENRDTSGTLVGGATYQLQGPRTSGSFLGFETGVSWNASLTVEDNIGQSGYNGLDLDPTPGEFLVKQIGSHSIVDTRRYRVRQVTAPSGYTFVNTANPWVEIPGNRNNPTGWSNQTYDFGDFQVRKIPPMSPVCEPGYVYGMLSTGQIRQVSPTGVVTSLGSSAGVSNGNFNGLGIGAGGSPVYAYTRGGSNASESSPLIYKYDTDTGAWSSTGQRVDSSNRRVTFVAGAVDFNTGNYYVGGFSDASDANNRVFRVWEYNPSTNTTSYKGAIATPTDRTQAANGDMAFDSNGNLFVVRGSGTTATIYSVTRADLVAASGGTIPSAVSETVTGTLNNVNGIAFDADGRGYLSSGSEVQRYSMPEWGNSENVTSLLNSGTTTSTGLASCGSPPTITIEKVIEGGRHAATNQFTLRLHQRNTLLGTATTTGSASGVQDQRVGPLPTVRNATLTFSETGYGANLSNYVSSYRCYVDDELYTQGTGTTGTITVPTTGQEVLCQFFNSPITAKVTINKLMADASGENRQPRQGWSVGAVVVAQTGALTTTPTAPIQSTNASGSATWDVKFTTAESTGKVTVFEDDETEPGFEFLEGQCLVTHLDGTNSLTELNGPDAKEIEGVQPGDAVECVYVNKIKDAKLTLVKQVENPAEGTGYAEKTDWTLSATGSGDASDTSLVGPTGTTGTVPSGTYSLSEVFSGTGGQSAGYTWSNLVCVDVDGATLESDAFSVEVGSDGQVDGGQVSLVPGDDVTCTFTNTPILGSVTWKKVDARNNPLSGSEWTLTGPGRNEDETITGNDGGEFIIQDLYWGEYSLQEMKAPAGYVLNSEVKEFTIDHSNLNQVFTDGFVNEQREGPDLPLTGGLGRDFYTLLGLSILVLGGGAAAVIRIRNRRKEVA